MKRSLKNTLYAVLLGGGGLLFTLTTVGCSDTKPEQTQPLTTQQAYLVGYDYLSLEEDQYVLNLTKSQAVVLGISEKDYARMVSDVRQTNVSIKESLGQVPAVKLTLPDPQNAEVKSKFNRLYVDRPVSKSKVEGGSQTISTGGADEGRAMFFLPWNAYSEINVACYATGFLQTFNVWAMTCGNTVTNGGVGFMGLWDCVLTVPCINTDCGLGFRTANTNGGSGTFRFYIEKADQN